MDVYDALIAERDAGHACALATIVNVQGSIPSHASAKMLVREDGSIAGTVGGGPVEAEVILAAREAIAEDKPRMAAFALRENPKLDTGMVCGGSLDIFIEPIVPAPVLHLFGAGHVGVLLARAARFAGMRTVIVDDRAAFANAERFPDSLAIHAGSFDASMAALRPNRRSMIFIATRCHGIDAEVLRWALGTGAGYIGMIGSQRKVLTIFDRLRGEGFDDAAFERVHAPVGLDIGARTPEEIAVSVVAELVAWRREAAAVRPLMRNMAAFAARIRADVAA